MNMSDRELNRLGAKFRLKKVLIRFHVTFEQYICNFEHYDKIIAFVDKNKAAGVVAGYGGIRVLH